MLTASSKPTTQDSLPILERRPIGLKSDIPLRDHPFRDIMRLQRATGGFENYDPVTRTIRRPDGSVVDATRVWL
jgi:hypothetical protein